MHAKKIFWTQKQASNVRVLVDFKRKKQDCLEVSIAIMKLNFLVFIELLRLKYIYLKHDENKHQKVSC
jgi:hypothetical protein